MRFEEKVIGFLHSFLPYFMNKKHDIPARAWAVLNALEASEKLEGLCEVYVSVVTTSVCCNVGHEDIIYQTIWISRLVILPSGPQ